MLHLLKKVSSNEHVRVWLSTALAPLGPASGDAPWGLEDALCQLDRLEAIAAESPSNLYIYKAEQFRRLDAPGLGRQIADRLRDTHRTVTARKLLLDIALALGTRGSRTRPHYCPRPRSGHGKERKFNNCPDLNIRHWNCYAAEAVPASSGFKPLRQHR